MPSRLHRLVPTHVNRWVSKEQPMNVRYFLEHKKGTDLFAAQRHYPKNKSASLSPMPLYPKRDDAELDEEFHYRISTALYPTIDRLFGTLPQNQKE
jgi:hypothetical protein